MAAGVVLCSMVLLVTADIVGRFALRPVKGSIDLGSLMLVLIFFWSVAYTQLVKGHVRTGLVIERLSTHTQVILDSVTSFLSAGIVGFMSWQLGNRAWLIMISSKPGPLTDLLNIPELPFKFMAFLGSLMLFLVLLIDLSHSLAQAVGKNAGKHPGNSS